jgi:hypothetical protein
MVYAEIAWKAPPCSAFELAAMKVVRSDWSAVGLQPVPQQMGQQAPPGDRRLTGFETGLNEQQQSSKKLNMP